MTDVRNPLFARFFSKVAANDDARRGVWKLRAEMLAGLSGRVVELGVGTGLNFPHYPAGVTELIAVEPEPYLREQATKAALTAPVPVTVVDAVADHLPFDAASFDGAVTTGVLCSVPDPLVALTELRRVLRPGGEFRFFEHVRSEHPVRGIAQDALSPLWARMMGGCRTNRRTRATIEAAGYTIVACREFTMSDSLRKWPVGPRILGLATV